MYMFSTYFCQKHTLRDSFIRTSYSSSYIHRIGIWPYNVRRVSHTLYREVYVHYMSMYAWNTKQKEPSVASGQKVTKSKIKIAVLRLFLTACGILNFQPGCPGYCTCSGCFRWWLHTYIVFGGFSYNAWRWADTYVCFKCWEKERSIALGQKVTT